ncbi:uncharacterized protein LOC135150784 [Daucus carota subsp. sativus]|uniref:uncharacterized protein LOC135150784 n=1 Tax=Daucus carota subsp. sativus TaxID=79200 RepID=UPI003082C221
MGLQTSEKVYRCAGCNVSFVPINKRSRRVILVADSTTNARLVLKAHDLEQIAGLTMLELITDCSANHAAKHGATFQNRINRIKDALCTFEVEAPVYSGTNSTEEIIITAIVEAEKLVGKRKPRHFLAQLDKNTGFQNGFRSILQNTLILASLKSSDFCCK